MSNLYLQVIENALSLLSKGQFQQADARIKEWADGLSAYPLVRQLQHTTDRQERAQLTRYLLSNPNWLGSPGQADPIVASTDVLDNTVILDMLLKDEWTVSKRLQMHDHLIESMGSALLEQLLTYHYTDRLPHNMHYLLLAFAESDARALAVIGNTPLSFDMYALIGRLKLNSQAENVAHTLDHQLKIPLEMTIHCLAQVDRLDLVIANVLLTIHTPEDHRTSIKITQLAIRLRDPQALLPIANSSYRGDLIDGLLKRTDEAALNLLRKILSDKPTGQQNLDRAEAELNGLLYLAQIKQALPAEYLDYWIDHLRQTWPGDYLHRLWQLILLNGLHSETEQAQQLADLLCSSDKAHKRLPTLNLNDTRLASSRPATVNAFMTRMGENLIDVPSSKRRPLIELLLTRPHPAIADGLNNTQPNARRGNLGKLFNQCLTAESWP